jgi:hypothetical protein
MEKMDYVELWKLLALMLGLFFFFFNGRSDSDFSVLGITFIMNCDVFSKCSLYEVNYAQWKSASGWDGLPHAEEGFMF